MMKTFESSIKAYKQAQDVIPGGVNSPVRAMKSVDMNPLFIERGKGSKIVDIDNNTFIDYVGSWGPLIAGHAHPVVVQALQEATAKGTSFGAPTEVETKLAKMVIQRVPSVEMVRMVSSGTEATMSALRLARAYTKRNKIIKFTGGYHGHADHLLIKAGSGVATLGLPDSPGVPTETANLTLSLPYNDQEAVNQAFEQYGSDIAAVIIEPVAGNMGVVPPQPGFLQHLRSVTQAQGALLVFDEVMTGFRVHYACAQSLYDVQPDLTCFGKIIGGGLPVGAYGGKQKIMELIAPSGPVYQAGTLSGNPLAMTAGYETLNLMTQQRYDELEQKSAYMEEGLRRNADRAGIDYTLNRVGSMLSLFFTGGPVTNFDQAMQSDVHLFKRYYHAMIEQGVYLAPSPFEAMFVSIVHTEQDIEQTLAASKQALATL